ncbi:MAG: hypothetical protein MJ117_08695 [Lachnospiraceae bacterium]|nr:hypothetical protein [Lachnospiraceae bacterium]
MRLLDTDKDYTHREKEKLCAKKKTQLVKEFRTRLQSCIKTIREEGSWKLKELSEEKDTVIQVFYHYPNGKNAAILHAIAEQTTVEMVEEETLYTVKLPITAYEEIALMLFEWDAFRKIKQEDADNTEGLAFLRKYYRLSEVNELIKNLQLYTDDFRSMRSVKDPNVKQLINEYTAIFQERKDAIWQQLILQGKESGRWVTEQKMFCIIHDHYPDAVFQYKPDWLRGQSVDVYIPSIKVAVEYQGLQHYSPVEFFGGREALYDNQKRDLRKKMRCEQQQVRLIYWDYYEPVTEEWFLSFMKPQILGEITYHVYERGE